MSPKHTVNRELQYNPNFDRIVWWSYCNSQVKTANKYHSRNGVERENRTYIRLNGKMWKEIKRNEKEKREHQEDGVRKDHHIPSQEPLNE